MCGIFGVVDTTTLRKKQVDFLSDAFITGGVRGLHGSGMFTVGRYDKVTSASEAVSGTDFLTSKKFKDVGNSFYSAVLAVGHNRFATTGDHIDNNCHPFEFGDITGVHNGTLSIGILDKIDPEDSHVVDSGRLYAAISRVDDPIEVLDKLYWGTYSLVWYDKRNNSLNFARNGGRPMHIAVTKTSMYFASEIGMLTWLMSRNNLVDSETEICSIDSETLYTVPLKATEKVTSSKYKAVAPKVLASPRGSSFRSSEKDDAEAREFYEEHGRSMVKPEKFELLPPYRASSFAERSRIFYDERSLLSMFPCLRSRMEFIHAQSKGLKGDNSVIIPVLMYGIYNVLPTVNNMYGAVTSADGSTHFSDVLAISRASHKVIMDFVQWMPDDNKDEQVTDKYFPIYWQHVDSYLVRPTGEIIVQGRPVLDKEPDICIAGIIQDNIDWAHYACTMEYLDQQDGSQIASMWADLIAGKVVFDDDVPF